MRSADSGTSDSAPSHPLGPGSGLNSGEHRGGGVQDPLTLAAVRPQGFPGDWTITRRKTPPTGRSGTRSRHRWPGPGHRDRCGPERRAARMKEAAPR